VAIFDLGARTLDILVKNDYSVQNDIRQSQMIFDWRFGLAIFDLGASSFHVPHKNDHSVQNDIR
jgi:hypothetical protein